MKRALHAAVIVLGLALAGARGAEIRFAAEPKAVAEGKGVKITFELADPTDVAVGIVNDHLISCFRYGELTGKPR